MKITFKSYLVLSIAVMLNAISFLNTDALAETPVDALATSREDLGSILEKYQQAIGGREAWEKLDVLKVSGNMHSLGTVFKTNVVYKRPDKCRLDFRAENMYFAESFDGTTPWQVGIAQRTQEPKELEGKRAEELKQTCDFDGPLVNHKKKGIKIEYQGLEEIEGEKGYKLKVTYKNGSVDTYYLNEKTYLPFLVLGTTTVKNRSLKSATRMRDYLETGDVKLAYYYEFELEGVPKDEIFHITSVELNPEVEKGYFSMPRNVKDSY